MKRTYLFIAIAILLAIIMVNLGTAIIARKKTNSRSVAFHQIDSTLQSYKDSMVPSEGLGAFKKTVGLNPTVGSSILRMIDTLQENYRTGSHIGVLRSYSDIKRVGELRLLDSIMLYNEDMWDRMDSAVPDTIDYWIESEPFSKKKWFSFYFHDKSIEERITYLNYLKYQIPDKK